MLAEAQTGYRFVRKTQLGPNEYRKNFHQIDREVMTVITSPEADQVTPLMSKIYLRLVNAPERFWEREGVLQIKAEVRDERLMKASAVLYDLVGVAAATASKAIQWMHEQGIIGYFSGKNGVGLRIFLNRAVSSIGARSTPVGKKFLAFPPGSSCEVLASPNEPAFNDSFAVLEVLDSGLNPHAPKNGADENDVVKYSSVSPHPAAGTPRPANPQIHKTSVAAARRAPGPIPINEIVSRLKLELEPGLLTAARRAAAHEHERTREWLENRGLPKAARVAQRETYHLLKQHVISDAGNKRARAALNVGRQEQNSPSAKDLTPVEVREVAESCVAMLEAHAQAIDVTLAEFSSEAGGFVLPSDAPRIRELAEFLARGCEPRE